VGFHGRTIVCVCIVAATALVPFGSAANGVRSITIHYRAHDGARRSAVVVVPPWVGNPDDSPMPLVISPHGRGVSARTNARLWGDLAAAGGFVVVSPDGQGRKLRRLSWGYPGQIEDLARMPQIVHRSLPWLHIDARQIFAVGGSMGGQEALLLAAQHPHLLAGAAAFDAVADFSLQYRNFVHMPCGPRCRKMWKEPLGRVLRRLAQKEVGGTPRDMPRAYAARSPITFARQLARACVPLELWWSTQDAVVSQQRRQSDRLFQRIRQLNRRAPITAFVGTWRHSHELPARLAAALAGFGLLPDVSTSAVAGVRVSRSSGHVCGPSGAAP
jgi:pimeloyl-ACP methyl ester carboxylesterase